MVEGFNVSAMKPWIGDGDAYDPVHKPSHYCHGGFETADVVEAVLLDAELDGPTSWWYGNYLKYSLRWPFKGQTPSERIRDLDKADECLRRAKECYERDQVRKRARTRELMGDGE